ncbi:transcription termination/antitermination protein NusA [bacterium (Candidatus Howlettbacteria) CG_4_10_14_0_8_um_filter_40_9]|nr:MAG: transcription termination/antitermination protein NusA [bacterium (Candidatus Howlettbacteria) CG_4_10_14_0_8_um_filter_40_9]
MQTQFIAAINQICDEKNIPREIVIETVEHALAAAYKKDYGHRDQEVRVELNEETGEINVFVSKEVVKSKEDIENNFLQIELDEAKKLNKSIKVGDMVEIEDHPEDFGRIAAQTAKQVIIQRIREAERDIVFSEYKDKEGELMNAVVQRIEGGTVIVDLGRASGVLFSNEQVQGERYYIGQRMKVYMVKVEQTSRGPQVVVSRSHPGVVRRLFELEVPEIETGIVEIKSIAREAGHRTKLAVSSNEENVDPVGSCVGQRGIRVQAVMADLGEEKIDIILWNEDPKIYITNALSPAKVIDVELNEKDKKATVKVPEDQLSLAIGKQGQNVRLAAKLTGWNVDISGADDSGIAAAEEAFSGDKGEKKDLEAEILKAVVEKSAPKDAEKEEVVVVEAVEPETETKEEEVISVEPEVSEPEEETVENDSPKEEETPKESETPEGSGDEIAEILEEEKITEPKEAKKTEDAKTEEPVDTDLKESEIAEEVVPTAEDEKSGEKNPAEDKAESDLAEQITGPVEKEKDNNDDTESDKKA